MHFTVAILTVMLVATPPSRTQTQLASSYFWRRKSKSTRSDPEASSATVVPMDDSLGGEATDSGEVKFVRTSGDKEIPTVGDVSAAKTGGDEVYNIVWVLAVCNV